MFYLDTADELSLLVSLCCSFFIFLASQWFKRAEIFSRLLGTCFASPLILGTASFIAHKKSDADALKALSELVLLLLILILAVSKPDDGRFNAMFSLFIAVPLAAWTAVSVSVPFQKFLNDAGVLIVSYLVVGVAAMYFFRKQDGPAGLVFWAVLPITAVATVGTLLPPAAAGYTVLVLKSASYCTFLVYFHRAYYKEFTVKITEAEKKINMVDRTLHMEVKKRVFEIEQVNRNLINKSKTDSLTKAFNKAAILDAIEQMIIQGGEFAILMFDIDNFKTINDTLGHVEGDKCIRRLAVIAKNNFRDLDVLGRYGGDEFIVALPGTGFNQAFHIAERFRKRIDSSEIPHFTVSIGIATFPNDGSTVKELVEAADEGLYHSKSKGRNAVSYRKSF